VRRNIGRPVPIDSMDADFIRGTVIVPAHDSVSMEIPVKLDKRIRAPRGEYSMFMMYNCGVNIANVIDERIYSMLKKNKAVLYQGYIRSNAIKLKIK